MNTVTKLTYKFSLIITLCAFSLTMVIPPSMAAFSEEDSLDLITGDLDVIPVKNLTRVSVTDPEVADISNAEADKITVLGKNPGQTIIFLWDASGKRSVTVNVTNQNMSQTKARIQKILEKSDIRGVSLEENTNEGKVIVSGSLNKETKERLEKVIEPYSDQIINLVKEDVNQDLVQIDMQLTELSTSLTKNLGVGWGTNGNDSITLKYQETLPAMNGKVEDFFKIGDFQRTNAMLATVNALVEEGKGRLLSKPRLVVLSGKEASFLVGGEIPIKSTTQNATGSSSVTDTTFKQYGIDMTITPTIKEGKVNVLLKVEIRDIDATLSTKTDVAFVTRNAQTELYLEDGQTIVLAGLIKHNDSQDVKKVPFLGNVPVIGLLFRNSRTPVANGDTELVISLTPTILKSKKFADHETVLPSPRTKDLVKEIESRYEQAPVNAPTVKVAPLQAAPKAIEPVVPQPVAVVPPPSAYVVQVQQKIAGAISYPYEALQNSWEGTVKLRLHLLKDGTLATSEVLESSGHDVFDRDALNTAKIVAPYPAFTPEMGKQEDFVVTVPIVYSQGTLSRAGIQTSQGTAAN